MSIDYKKNDQIRKEIDVNINAELLELQNLLINWVKSVPTSRNYVTYIVYMKENLMKRNHIWYNFI